MKKKMVITSLVIILFGLIYYAFFYSERFSSGAEGVFLSEDYEENYNVVTTEIEINKVKFDQLIIQHHVLLDNGDLTYEIYDPEQKLIDSGYVEAGKELFKQMEMKPVKGKWFIKYYITKQTNGNYIISMKSK